MEEIAYYPVVCNSCGAEWKVASSWSTVEIISRHRCGGVVNVSVEVGEQRPNRLGMSWQMWLRIGLAAAFLLYVYGWLVNVAWVVFAGAFAVGVFLLARITWQELAEGNRRLKAARAELVARCDEQHLQVMQGDPEGTFGVATPVVKQLQEWETDNG